MIMVLVLLFVIRSIYCGSSIGGSSSACFFCTETSGSEEPRRLKACPTLDSGKARGAEADAGPFCSPAGEGQG